MSLSFFYHIFVIKTLIINSMNLIDISSLEIFKTNRYFPTSIGMVSDNAYISIVATNKCQCSCPYCINSDTDHSLSLPIDKAISNIRKIVSMYGVKEAIILGGEPLLHNDIIELIRRLRTETGLKMIRLTTNGIKLRDDKMLPLLFHPEYGIQGINISCHNEDFMPYNELEKICKKIKTINPCIKIRINSNIWKNNLDTIIKFIKHYNRIKEFADEIRISNIIPKNSFSVNSINKAESLILSDEKYEEIFTSIIDNYSQLASPIVNEKTLGFVKYVLLPLKCPIIINWNVNSQVSEQVDDKDKEKRKINTFKCLVNGEISLSWNEQHIITPQYHTTCNMCTSYEKGWLTVH